MAANPRLGLPLDAIPTPRTEAEISRVEKLFTRLRCTKVTTNYRMAFFEISMGEMAQLERELHSAKQALEKIVQERFYPMSKRLATAEGLAENALQEIKNLTK